MQRINSILGDVTKSSSSDLDPYSRHSLTVVASDSGLGNRGTEVNLRIDTFDPNKNIIIIDMTRSLDDFLNNQEQFLLQMTQICSIKFQDCNVKVCISMVRDLNDTFR